MASKKKEHSSWLDMLNISGNQTNPAVASQLAQQSMPPEEPPPQLGGMSMPPEEPPPKPQMMTPAPKPVRRTAQPTTQRLGEIKQEVVPRQISLMSDESIMTNGPNSRLMQELAMGEKSYATKMALQQNDVDELKRGLDKYRNSPRDFDFRPLATLVDSMFGGGGRFSKTADAMAPDSKSQKDAKILEMQKQIAGAQGELTKSELEGLRNKLQQIGYEEQRKTQLDIARINAANGRRAQLDEREEARRERQTLDYANHVGKQSQTMAENISNLEQGLGFSLDEIDSKTGLVNGQEVDIAGVSIPGVGRVNVSEEAADLEARFAPIFNTVLKDRSGAAVTTPELERLKNEFSQGKYNSEAKLLAATRRFRDAAKKTLKAQEAGYPKEIKPRYKDQGGKTVDEHFAPQVAAPSGGGSGPGGKMSFDEWKKSKAANP